MGKPGAAFENARLVAEELVSAGLPKSRDELRGVGLDLG